MRTKVFNTHLGVHVRTCRSCLTITEIVGYQHERPQILTQLQIKDNQLITHPLHHSMEQQTHNNNNLTCLMLSRKTVTLTSDTVQFHTEAKIILITHNSNTGLNQGTTHL